MNLDHGRGKLANRRLMTRHRLEIGRDVGVDGQCHIEENNLADALERFGRLCGIPFEMIQQARVDEREITPVRA